MSGTYKNKTTPPITRIRRVLLDHTANTVDRVVSHISSIVIPPFCDDMIAIVD